MNVFGFRSMLFAGASALALCSDPASAQSAGPTKASSEIETVTVTAEKRTENVQNVPLSITAISGNEIRKLHQTNLLDLQGQVPDVQINHAANSPAAVFSIRGIGSGDPDPFVGSPITTVIDGVPLYFNQVGLAGLLDVNRIEVLKGPQGTLFGANTTGGVVSIISQQPTGDYSGYANLTYGNYGRLDEEGAFNLPLVADELAARVSFLHSSTDGYITNIVDGKGMGSTDDSSARVNLQWTPTTKFSANLILEYDRFRDGSVPAVNMSLPGDAFYVAPGTTFPNAVLPMYASPCKVFGQTCRADNPYESADNSVPDISPLDNYAATLQLNWDSSAGQLVSITGYRRYVLETYEDFDHTPLTLASNHRKTDAWQFTQELRDTIQPSDDLQIQLGAFVIDDHYDQFQNLALNALTVRQYNTQDQDNWSGSLFAQSYYNVTPKLRLEAGVRLSYEKTDMLAATFTYGYPTPGDVSFTGGTLLPPPASVLPEEGQKAWTNVGGKIGAQYNWTDDLMTYAYYARGFKSGGFVGRLGLPTDIGPYNPEYVDTFEVGEKGEWFDRRLLIDGAVFYNLYHDKQLSEAYFTTDSNGNIIQGNSILNAAQAQTKGVELDVRAIPVEGLTLNVSAAYVDAHYTNFLFANPDTGTTDNLAGRQLENVSPWTASAGFSYTAPVATGAATLSMQYRFTAPWYDYEIDPSAAKLQATNYIDGNFDWTPDGAKWTIGTWVRNLADKHYIVSHTEKVGLLGIGSYGPPREYGLTFKYNW
jgi:iron complex outermembrane recepter protein